MIRKFAPIVDPQVDPATEGAARVILDEGWPIEAVLAWAMLTMRHTRHILVLSMAHRTN